MGSDLSTFMEQHHGLYFICELVSYGNREAYWVLLDQRARDMEVGEFL